MSPRTAKQLLEIREQSRKKILDAALELFATHGYHNTSIEQIRKKAEVSKGLIYNYFDKKEDLIKEIVFDLFKGGDEVLGKISSLSTPQEQFKFLVEYSFDFMVKQPEYSRLMTSLSLQLEQFPEISSLIKSKYLGYLPLFEDLLTQLGVPNARGEAMLLGAVMDGVGVEYIILGDAVPLDEIKTHLYQKYLGEEPPQTNQ